MKSKNPMTRKRQRRHRKERQKNAKQAYRTYYYEEIAAKYSPYYEDRFMLSSCMKKNRYKTEEQAICACIKGFAKRGVKLLWYKCGRCGGWHITSRCKDDA